MYAVVYGNYSTLLSDNYAIHLKQKLTQIQREEKGKKVNSSVWFGWKIANV